MYHIESIAITTDFLGKSNVVDMFMVNVVIMIYR